MAKEPNKAKVEKKKADQEEFKFGINHLAEALKIKPASARVQLRDGKIKKAGKSYGWNTKAELDEVVKKLKETSGKKEAPAKKAEAKAPVKKVKKEAA